jgi:hypothetical protein
MQVTRSRRQEKTVCGTKSESVDNFPIPAGRLCDPRGRLIHVCLYVAAASSGAAAQATVRKVPCSTSHGGSNG